MGSLGVYRTSWPGWMGELPYSIASMSLLGYSESHLHNCNHISPGKAKPPESERQGQRPQSDTGEFG